MKASLQEGLARAWQGLRWALLLPALASLLYFHWQIVVFPLAHEGTEAAIALSAQHLAQGGDPSSGAVALRDLPYGFVHAQLTAMAGPRLAGDLVFQRAFSAVCLGLTLGLLWLWALRRGFDRWAACAALISAYAGLLVWVTPHARPDALCLFLAVAAMLCAWEEEGTWWPVLAGALGVLAFYTKAYGAIALIGGAGCYAWRRDLPALGRLIGAALLSALVCHTWVLHRFTAYYAVVFGIQGSAVTWRGDYLIAQSGYFLLQQGLLVASLAWGLSGRARQLGRLWVAAPLLPALLALLVLGGHVGAFMSYYCQLALPWLALCSVAWMPPRGPARAAASLLLIANAYLAMGVLRYWQPWTAAECRPMLQAAEGIFAVAKPGQVLAGPEFLPLVQRYQQVLADNDDLRWFCGSGVSAPPEQGGGPYAGLQRSAARHVKALQADLRQGRYEWVLLNAESPVLEGADLSRYDQRADKPYHAPGNPFGSPGSVLWLQRSKPMKSVTKS